MSRRVELQTAALTALTELSAVTNDKFDRLPEDRIRQQLRTARDLATSLNGLPALPSISRQGTLHRSSKTLVSKSYNNAFKL